MRRFAVEPAAAEPVARSGAAADLLAEGLQRVLVGLALLGDALLELRCDALRVGSDPLDRGLALGQGGDPIARRALLLGGAALVRLAGPFFLELAIDRREDGALLVSTATGPVRVTTGDVDLIGRW